MPDNVIPNAALRALLLALLVHAPGCGTLQLQPRAAVPSQEEVITAAQIERSGARTAWEALRRSHVHLSFFEGNGGEARQLGQRGSYQQAPLVVIDGLPAADGFRQLSQLPAPVIARIRVLTATAAMPRFGAAAGGGAILIETRKGPHR